MKPWVAGAAAILLSASMAMAVSPPAEPAAPTGGKPAFARYDGPPKNRAEAIKRTEERLATLKGMSDADWEKMRANRAEKRHARRDKMKQGAPAAGAPAAPAQ